MRVMRRYQRVLQSFVPALMKSICAATTVMPVLNSIAQDSPPLKSLTGPYAVHAAPIFTYMNQGSPTGTRERSIYQLIGKFTLPSNKPNLDARYRPSLNPLLQWKNVYPLTADELYRRLDEQNREEKIGNQVANEVVETIFRRKKQKAVKPKF